MPPSSPETISIIIPTRNRVDLLKSCLQSIEKADTRSINEIIVVDNDSTDDATLAFLQDQESAGAIKVARVPGSFNYARLNNIAVAGATSTHICLLNNDIEIVSRDWLEEMLGRLLEPSVGAVGALLVWPSNVVQHGGVVVGLHYAAEHAFTGRFATDPGYTDLLRVAHECSAVTAACLLTRKQDYQAMGGLDEVYFPVNFNDVDYCLKLRALGKRVVFTPHTRLIHHESVSRGQDYRADQEWRARRELACLRARWQDALLEDPFYNPNLALTIDPYTGLAVPNRATGPRTNAGSPPTAIPPGF